MMTFIQLAFPRCGGEVMQPRPPRTNLLKRASVLAALFFVPLSLAAKCADTPPPTVPPSVVTIQSFTASPDTLQAGGNVTLSWQVEGATTLNLEPNLGAVTGTSQVVNVLTSTTFTLTATNGKASVSKTTTVSVKAANPTDTTPPTLLSVNPPNNATGIESGASIVITFSEPMDQAATQVAYQSASLTASEVIFSWNADSTVLTLKPNAPLVYNAGNDPTTLAAKRYDFSVTNTAKDKAGNPLATVSSSFTTLRHITSRLTANDGSVKKGTLVDTESESLYVGDHTDNSGIRSFLSFSLASVPEKATSLKATLSLYKELVKGSPYTALEDCLPACTVTGATITLDHVDYGETLSLGAYDTASLATLGKFDDRFIPELTFLTADVTERVADDLANRTPRGNRSQYRLSFPLESNKDSVSDHVLFLASDRARDGFPTLTLDYLAP